MGLHKRGDPGPDGTRPSAGAATRPLFSFFLVLLLTPLLLAALATSAAAQGQRVRVGIYENAPKVFTDESGKPAGIFVDVMNEIARREGWEVEYVHGSWGEGLDRVARGEIDLMPDVARTPEREAQFTFHEVPVMASWFQVFARHGSGIRSVMDLMDKRIAVLERSVQHDAFVRLVDGFGVKTKLIPLPDYERCFEMVQTGEADAAITNRLHGLIHAPKYGLEDTSVIFFPTNLCFAGPPEGRPELFAAIDRQLTDLKANPASIYYQSLKRWSEQDVKFNLPDWVYRLGIVAVTVLLVSLGASLVLKRQVNVRTRQLRQANQEMEQRIVERTAELATAMERAQEADNLKSAFLATMSHELRTPLNSIIGFTGILLQELPGPLNDEQKKQMQMVQTSARHLLALINDVLDISKIEAGQLNLAISEFDLRPSIEKVVTIVKPLAEKKDITLEVNIAPEIGHITADQRRFEQILLNLMTNAIKFTESGSVRLDCHTDDAEYVFAVSDTGIGIQPQHMSGLFRPFHQIDSGLSRRHEGTGLGLSICRKLAGMMGGSIGVVSEWERGSTFTVRLPANSGEST